MKRIILPIIIAMLLSACGVVIETSHHDHSQDGHDHCYEDEPHHHEPIQVEYYYNYHTGYYEGVCAVWYVNSYYVRRKYEEWCNWGNTCGWEYVASYANYNY